MQLSDYLQSTHACDTVETDHSAAEMDGIANSSPSPCITFMLACDVNCIIPIGWLQVEVKEKVTSSKLSPLSMA